MRCDYQTVCPFYRRKIKTDDAVFSNYVGKYCEGDSTECAEFSVIQEASFLAVPMDLMPDQNHRVYTILSNSIYA